MLQLIKDCLLFSKHIKLSYLWPFVQALDKYLSCKRLISLLTLWGYHVDSQQNGDAPSSHKIESWILPNMEGLLCGAETQAAVCRLNDYIPVPLVSLFVSGGDILDNKLCHWNMYSFLIERRLHSIPASVFIVIARRQNIMLFLSIVFLTFRFQGNSCTFSYLHLITFDEQTE